LVDQSRDGIVVLDQSGKVYEANQRFAEMLGYTPEEVRELHVWDWEYLRPRERVLEMIRMVDEAGDHFETQHRRKDGSIYNVEISTNGAVFAGQKLIFCVCRDITERKRMEEALKLAAEEWSRTFESISDAVSIHDRDFRILRANRAFAGLFQKSLNEIIGVHCYELHKGEKPRSGCPHQNTLTTG
jgi:PAS domain S-box-containing protein